MNSQIDTALNGKIVHWQRSTRVTEREARRKLCSWNILAITRQILEVIGLGQEHWLTTLIIIQFWKEIKIISLDMKDLSTERKRMFQIHLIFRKNIFLLTATYIFVPNSICTSLSIKSTTLQQDHAIAETSVTTFFSYPADHYTDKCQMILSCLHLTLNSLMRSLWCSWNMINWQNHRTVHRTKFLSTVIIDEKSIIHRKSMDVKWRLANLMQFAILP